MLSQAPPIVPCKKGVTQWAWQQGGRRDTLGGAQQTAACGSPTPHTSSIFFFNKPCNQWIITLYMYFNNILSVGASSLTGRGINCVQMNRLSILWYQDIVYLIKQTKKDTLMLLLMKCLHTCQCCINEFIGKHVGRRWKQQGVSWCVMQGSVLWSAPWMAVVTMVVNEWWWVVVMVLVVMVGFVVWGKPHREEQCLVIAWVSGWRWQDKERCTDILTTINTTK